MPASEPQPLPCRAPVQAPVRPSYGATARLRNRATLLHEAQPSCHAKGSKCHVMSCSAVSCHVMDRRLCRRHVLCLCCCPVVCWCPACAAVSLCAVVCAAVCCCLACAAVLPKCRCVSCCVPVLVSRLATVLASRPALLPPHFHPAAPTPPLPPPTPLAFHPLLRATLRAWAEQHVIYAKRRSSPPASRATLTCGPRTEPLLMPTPTPPAPKCIRKDWAWPTGKVGSLANSEGSGERSAV